MSKPATHRADERRFLDERGSEAKLAPNGLNPATILEKAVRERIVDSYFYKEQLFGVNEADVVDMVVQHVDCVGGVHGTIQKPTPFLCLAFKLLQLAPGDDVLAEYLEFGGERFKYLRALAVFYLRLTRPDHEVYKTLEPFLADKRKLRQRTRDGMKLTYMDQFVDDLLTKTRACATSLWRMRDRSILEDLELLEERKSPLGSLDDLLEEEDEAMQNGEGENGEVHEEESESVRPRSRSRSRSRTRSGSRLRSRDISRYSSRERSRSRSRSRRAERSSSRSGFGSRAVRRRSDHDRMDIDGPEQRSEGETSP